MKWPRVGYVVNAGPQGRCYCHVPRPAAARHPGFPCGPPGTVSLCLRPQVCNLFGRKRASYNLMRLHILRDQMEPSFNRADLSAGCVLQSRLAIGQEAIEELNAAKIGVLLTPLTHFDQCLFPPRVWPDRRGCRKRLRVLIPGPIVIEPVVEEHFKISIRVLRDERP